MPLVHLEDGPDVLDVEEQTHDVEKTAARAKAQAALPVAKQPDAIDLAMEALTAAVATEDVEKIAEAQRGLEQARLDAQVAHQRAKDLSVAQTAARAAKAAAEKKKQADHAAVIEKHVRAKLPRIQFMAPLKRSVLVTIGGSNLEPSQSTEAIRRIAHAMNQAHAVMLAESKIAGRKVPVADWLSPLLDSDAGLRLQIAAGVVKIVKEK